MSLIRVVFILSEFASYHILTMSGLLMLILGTVAKVEVLQMILLNFVRDDYN